MIDRYLLRYFLAVIDHGNFSRAADSCNVTQPTLSVGIAKLEQTIGRTLFNRTNRRVDLTSAGATFALHARRIEEAFNTAERAVSDAQTRPVVRLGVINTLPSAMIGAMTHELTRRRHIQIELVEGRDRDLLERLRTKRIDAAISIVHDQNPAFVAVPLFHEGYSLALPAAHPMAFAEVIKAEDLADNVMLVRRQCEILTQTSQHFTKRGVRPFFSARTMNDDRALAYVAAGLGITVMPDCFRAEGVARVPMAEFPYSRTIGTVHRGDNDLVDSITALLKLVIKTVLNDPVA